ncbi:MAG: sigma-54 interaction domain-containing protein, partial [Longimicrobiales bacterium]
MGPTIGVLRDSDSFAAVWPELVASAGGTLRIGADVSELAPATEPCALVVSSAGVEATAPARVAELRSAGAQRIAVVGSDAGHRAAVAVLTAGASEYYALPGDLEALRAWLMDQVARCEGSLRAATLAAEERRSYDFSRLVGRSEDLRAALARAARIIPHASATVLLTGETGTGKELVAQAIHYNGPRAAQPFVEVNCTALPPGLLEAELFGYEKGAFTDARAPKPGLFEAAHGGTLFLDEIGDLPHELQGKLLRALEEKRVRRLGSVRDLSIDARIIAATHVDLGLAVRERRFRDDLYYRLNVVPIHLPPLRERGEDILLLADAFLRRFAEQYAVGDVRLTEPVRRALLDHPWPGNVRELRNALERAILLGDGELSVRDLFPAGLARESAATLPFPAPLDEIERA